MDIEAVTNAILNQTSIYVQNSCEITPEEVGVYLYECIANNNTESECLFFFSELFTRIDTAAREHEGTKNALFYFQKFFQYFLTQTFCDKSPPHSNVLGIWKDPLQTLYCPERKKFVMIMSLLSGIPVATEVIDDNRWKSLHFHVFPDDPGLFQWQPERNWLWEMSFG